MENQYFDLYNNQRKLSTLGAIGCIITIYLITYSANPIHSNYWLILIIIWYCIVEYSTKKIYKLKLNKIYYLSIIRAVDGIIYSLPLLEFINFKETEKAIITIILMASTAASASTTNGFKKQYLWFATPILISLGIAWSIVSFLTDTPHWTYYAIVILIIFYFPYLINSSNNLFNMYEESNQLRFLAYERNVKLNSALEDAKNANLAKTRFLASASHDLRQPMHTLGVLLAALIMRQLDKRSREIVDIMSMVNASLSTQLDGLLDMSKLDAGAVTTDLQVCSLDELVRTHVANITLNAQQKNLYIRVHSDQAVFVRTDALLLERVLMNLTGNALKFTEYGGVDISIHVAHQKVILEVADTGIGIKPDFHSLVFQEFYQVSNPERDRNAGLGLGLSIVQRICALLNINLHLSSVHGRGSCFVLTMPQVEDDTQPHAKIMLPHTIEIPAMNVLIIDDEREIRTGMRLLLEELGCSVVLADGIEQAVSAAKTQKFNIVFSDYRLRHDENGIEAIKCIRVVQPGLHAVLFSGDTASEHLQNAQNARISMLHKPVSFKAILKELQKTALSAN